MLAGTVLAILFTVSFTTFADTCAEIRSDTLRLHILANSDSAADQSLKLAVRDEILRETGGVFAQASTKQQAVSAASAAKDRIRAAALRVVRQKGYSYSVTVQLVKMHFKTTRYERPAGAVTLPAGEYDAVRVIIGEGAGHNWFCVLFPQLCLPAAEEKNTDSLYTKNEQRVLCGGYEVRLALLDLLEENAQKSSSKQRKDDSSSLPQSEAASSAGQEASKEKQSDFDPKAQTAKLQKDAKQENIVP